MRFVRYRNIYKCILIKCDRSSVYRIFIYTSCETLRTPDIGLYRTMQYRRLLCNRKTSFPRHTPSAMSFSPQSIHFFFHGSWKKKVWQGIISSASMWVGACVYTYIHVRYIIRVGGCVRVCLYIYVVYHIRTRAFGFRGSPCGCELRSRVAWEDDASYTKLWLDDAFICAMTRSYLCAMSFTHSGMAHIHGTHTWHTHECGMAHIGWLRLVGSLKSCVSFAKEPYKRDDIVQKRPVILRSLWKS